MFLSRLDLQNFRNFPKNSFSFSFGSTLVLGPNTSGKTNILEAIYLLATGRSFRAEVEKEVIKWGEEIARINCKLIEASHSFLRPEPITFGPSSQRDNMVGSLESGVKGSLEKGNASLLEIVLTAGQVSGQPAPHKKYLINSVSKRMVDFVGNLRAVLFWPEDLELVTNSPSVRRKYLDLVLSQVDREYRRCLLSYEKGLRQRNKLLERIRDENISRSQLLFWDKLLIRNGAVITDKRQEFIEFVNNKTIEQWNNEIMGQFSLEYDKSVISGERLAQYSHEEVAAGATLVGPQRDDIKFEIRSSKFETKDTSDGVRMHSSEVERLRDLSLYGSRGEQRLAILWLKLAELEFVASKTRGRPILLLDDIFSELDHEHREYVLKIIPQQQTIITTTDLHLVDEKFLKDTKIIKLGV